MLTIIITPCLLGFDVKTRSGCFERSRGIYSASELVRELWHTEGDFRVILR